MKKNYLLLSLALFVVSTTLAQTSKRVLFIGNSYVTSNNLPQMVRNAAQSTGKTLTVDQSAPGGQSFSQHVNNATTLSKIAQGNWDFVVLQEQSQRPSFGNGYVQNNVYPYAAQLNDLIEQANPCGETLFYMTWGRENGDQSNCAYQPALCTYEGMDDLLQQRYHYMAETNDAELAPVAAVWRYIRTHHPEIDLYSSDGSHPSVAGTYAAACTFYTVLYRENPTAISFYSTLAPDVAQIIQTAAETVVFQNLSQWLIGKYDAPTAIQASPNGLSVQFQSPVNSSLRYEWDFGDNQTSTANNPLHTYAAPGVYTVKQTVYECDELLTDLYIELDLTTLGNIDFTTNLALYPNPAKTQVHLPRTDLTQAFAVNTLGQRIPLAFTSLESESVVDVAALPEGIYYLQLLLNNQWHTQHLVKQP